MYYDLTDVKIEDNFHLKVTFHDGLIGYVRFLPSAFRGVFEAINTMEAFSKATIEDGVLTWPFNIDLAPDAMHASIKTHGEWVLD